MSKLNEQQAVAVADALLGPQQAKIDAKRQRQQAARKKANAQRMAWALPCLTGATALGLMDTAPILSAGLAVLALTAMVALIIRK